MNYTVSDIRASHEQHGGRFFSRENMKFAGDTLSNFGVKNIPEQGVTVLYRKRGKLGFCAWKFDHVTGDLRTLEHTDPILYQKVKEHRDNRISNW